LKKFSKLEPNNTNKSVIVILVLIIIIMIILVFLSYSSRSSVLTELNNTQNQLQISRNINSQLQTQIENMRTANTNAQYILMSDINARIPKTISLMNVVVGVETNVSPSQPFAHFTSSEILTGIMAHPAGPYSSNQCALGDSPLGVITRYSAGSKVFGKVVDTIIDQNVKKLGNYYYVYSNSATSCSSNQAVSEIIIAQQQAFAAAFANIELIDNATQN
jgi:hypothetical protein